MKKSTIVLLHLAGIAAIAGGYYSFDSHQKHQEEKSIKAEVKKQENAQPAHMTRLAIEGIQNKHKDTNDFRAPDLSKTDLISSDIPSSKQYNPKTGQYDKVVAWDSWPVTTPDGTVANFHGYRLQMALTSLGRRDDGHGAKIGLYAQKISDKNEDISSWQYLGDVFATFGEGRDKNKEDECLDSIVSEWSGSSYLMDKNDSTLRVFYTNAMPRGGDQGQALTTAKIQLEPKQGKDWSSGLTINHEKASDHKTLFTGDGKIYQTAKQATRYRSVGDSFAMRDPHFVKDGNRYYLTFEGNTGTDFHPQGENNFLNADYYGNQKEFENETNRLKNPAAQAEYDRIYMANAAHGKLELNKDFTVKKVLNPILTANASYDMIERPNLFEYKGKWYFFTCFFGDGYSSVYQHPYTIKKTYLFGYVSDDGINGQYKPLNGNGLVLQGAQQDPYFTYAYLPVKPEKIKNDEIIITSFQNSRTFAPSYLLKLDGHKTKVINDRVLSPGALTTTGKTFKSQPQHD
ncbi:glycoside hydrolase family 68 protein [Fructobacillus sp. W13]|uniref:Glycoside hydrolase family 68 protein n=1 Tax=Fructobacillus apis TaxID=2935017 RepID=A0ABT0ZNY0_9LACO|nr:glycoside hydrolase family 68 protein [Fructobacillus apis]MCO0831694.1 glycoside hydrolase family 68 protein [Fructobacillus apis]